MRTVTHFPITELTGGCRADITASDHKPDWFVGHGKDDMCPLEGSWWDMICLAREILASENTKLAAPEYYQPELACTVYEPAPYTYTGL